MSSGYTIAFAITAPVAPATAKPHGGIKASFDCAAMAKLSWNNLWRIYESVGTEGTGKEGSDESLWRQSHGCRLVRYGKINQQYDMRYNLRGKKSRGGMRRM